MIDKLVLLSPLIRRPFVEIAMEEGEPKWGYERCVDLRDTALKLPVKLFYRGRHTQIHKLEFIGVARLGLPRTREIAELIFPILERVRIYRIDLCVDLLGFSPWFFVTNVRLPRQQNFGLYRSRGAVSFYLQFSAQRKILFYDRLRLLRKDKHPLAALFNTNDELTRIEVQMMGAAVPFKRFLDIGRYAEIEPLKHLQITRLRIDPGENTPVKVLAAYGLRWLVHKYGQQAASKIFPPSAWAALQAVYLERMEHSDLPPLGKLMRKGIMRWLIGQIHFPRAREGEK